MPFIDPKTDPATAGAYARAEERQKSSNAGAPPLQPASASFPEFPKAALYGPTGAMVSNLCPHTEAHPAAILGTLLVAYGNIIGRSAFIFAGNERHHANFFIGLVGNTASGRKGTSLAVARTILDHCHGDWIQNNLVSGLSSGEGLIHHIRDPLNDDIGQADKRVLVSETELAIAFARMKREGSSLGPVLRQSWDGTRLAVLTKTNPAAATNPHVSILGHISREELGNVLSATEIMGGTANRFIWLPVCRTQCLPNAPRIPDECWRDEAERIAEALRNLNSDHPVDLKRTTEADQLWAQDYEHLSDYRSNRPENLAKVLGRAEAQVTRLSLLYAILDGAKAIGAEHHRAAMALWAYAEEGARWIFGGTSSTGHKDADRILEALKKASGQTLTKSDISRSVFRGNAQATRITSALVLLERLGLIQKSKDAGTGQPENWKVVPPPQVDETDEFNEPSAPPDS